MFQCIHVCQVPRELLKTSAKGVVENSRGTWQTLIHEKTCLIIGIKHGFSCINVCQARGRCWKPRPKAEVFNNSRGTKQTLMHWKTMFDRCYCINSTTTLKNNKNGRALFSTSSQLPWRFLHALSIIIKILVSGHGHLLWFFPTVSRI